VIERCLAKNPAQRFHSAHDLAFALRSMSSPAEVHKVALPLVGFSRRALASSIAVVTLILATGGFYYWRNRAGQGIDSLAVLPFVNSSESPDADYLGEQYDRKVADVLAVQREIAAEITGKLRARLSNERKTQVAKRQTDNPAAYRLYLKGHNYASKFDTEDLSRGLDYFHQGLALDSNYALACQGIAEYYNLATDWLTPPTGAGPRAEEADRKALDIDDTLIESSPPPGL
jgi:hypothetical protein